MPRVLVTAFEPYGPWRTNASWLALMELTRDFPKSPSIVTRRYPVDYDAVRQRLQDDLAQGYDFSLHLGQAPGSSAIRLEQFALNVRDNGATHADGLPSLAADGPAAYRSRLPLADWAARLRQIGIPAQVSHHAGTYLCNATLYWSHYLCEQQGWHTQSAFVHLPLEPSQALDEPGQWPSMTAAQAAMAVRTLLTLLA